MEETRHEPYSFSREFSNLLRSVEEDYHEACEAERDLVRYYHDRAGEWKPLAFAKYVAFQRQVELSDNLWIPARITSPLLRDCVVWLPQVVGEEDFAFALK